MLDISKFNGVSVSRYFKVLETLIAEYCKVSISWVLVEIPDYKMLQTNFFTWIQNLMTLTITSTGFGFLVTVDETLTGNPLAALLYNIFSSNPILHVFVNMEKEHFLWYKMKWEQINSFGVISANSKWKSKQYETSHGVREKDWSHLGWLASRLLVLPQFPLYQTWLRWTLPQTLSGSLSEKMLVQVG